MKKKKDSSEEIQESIESVLKSLGVDGDFNFTQNEEEISVVLNTKDTGIVIGYHGETLEALQLVLSIIISKKIDKFIRVIIEVGDYRKNRSEWLENLALKAKEQAILEKKEISLPSLRSWERRIVHVLFQEDTEVMSESIGQGRDRTLIIKPRS
ncbi:MAG: KH domain-containing protein [bacterium]|nr:KH domain-containing protein [bacterium]